MRPEKPSKSVRRARGFRRELSLPEAMLWKFLRASPNGYKFRRQHPAGPYILDFFCARANLAVEIDGMSHEMGDAPSRDQRRDHWLEEHRIDTLRIAARDVLDSPAIVAQSILDIVEHRLMAFGKTPPSSLRDATSPSQVDGEETEGS